MPGTVAVPNILTDPGIVYWAPLGTSEPTNSVTASKFTDSWPAGWLGVGATEDGSEFSYETKVDAIKVAEFFDPIKWSTTDRSGSLSFNMADYTLTNWSRAINGGTKTVVSGTTTTQLNSFVPPTPGNEVRAMLGWESLDNTMRIIMYQCINSGTITSAYKKAPDFAVIPCQFNFEVPSAGQPWKMYTAGTARA
jgi:hypothetical protein